jgi:hypothetical protein
MEDTGPENKDSLIANLTKPETDEKQYSVVFDIDDTICAICFEYEIPQEVRDLFPGCEIIDFKHGGNIYPHFFYPYFGEVILNILSWGWNVYFFSSGKAIRNEDVIPRFLKQVLSKYTDSTEKCYAELLAQNRIGIFSEQNLSSIFASYSLQTGFDLFSTYKKNINITAPDPKNTILVEDDRSYVLGCHYPYIGLDNNASANFPWYLEILVEHYLNNKPGEHPKEFLEDGYSALNNAHYVMGILSQCKEILDNGEAYFLRQALDKIVHNESYYTNKSAISDDDTPWFLSPLPEFNPKSSEFIQKGTNTILEWHKKYPSKIHINHD